MTSQTYLTLHSGQKLPALGLGTWQASDEKQVEAAVKAALELGYRHIDTAWVYQNEVPIGRVLKEWISSGKVKREDLFITTKLPLTGVHPDRVELFMKKSLENLQLDYVDLYLIHFPIGFQYQEGVASNLRGASQLEPKTDHAAVWKKMEEQVAAGRAKNIGLSNYNISQIKTVLQSAKIKPANLQVELHVYLQQHELVDFCTKNGITVVAYCPLSNPSYNTFLTNMGKETKEVMDLLGDPVVGKIAAKHKKTPAQIVLRFLLQIGVSAIPKSVNPKRIKENFNVFDFTLDQSDMKALRDLEKGEKARLADFKLFEDIDKHPDYPFPKK